MARFRFFLLSPNSKKESPIFLSITYSGKRVKLKTKEKIYPKAWNKVSNSIRKNYTEYQDTQKKLDQIELIAKSEFFKIKEQFGYVPVEKELRKLLEGKVFNENTNSINSFWEYFTKFNDKLKFKKNDKTGNPISKGTIDNYNQTYNCLSTFEKSTNNILSFTTLSNDLYDNLVSYLENQLLFSPNTVGKHIKNFKRVINSALESNNTIVLNNYNERYWKVFNQAKSKDEIVFLNEKELNELENLDVGNNLIFDKARDIFLIGAWTALRISDIGKLNNNQINQKKRIIQFHTQKTNKSVVIPLHPVVLKILKKYKGKAPQLQEQKVNKSIKILCSKIKSLNEYIFISETKGNVQKKVRYKKFEKITTHTARKSFASNMLNKGVPVQQIMAVTGHSKESTFYRYIGVADETLVQDLANKFDDWYN